MSKSKNNGVDPQELIDTMGADTARLFTMFASPPEQTLEWNDAGVEGAHRFVKRVWNFGAKNAEAIKAAGTVVQGELTAEDKALRREVYVILKQISYDYERMQYNTVASGAMKLLNLLETQKDLLEGWASSPDEYTRAGVNVQGALAVVREGFGVLLRGLYPACPHLTHVLWEDLGYAAKDGGDLLDAPWPKVVEEALVQDEIELMLQVNGKLRGAIKVSPTADKAAIEAAALASEDFVKFSEGKAPKKVIIVPGRLVNLVV
jgi:leucyl-tRNA synthetase